MIQSIVIFAEQFVKPLVLRKIVQVLIGIDYTGLHFSKLFQILRRRAHYFDCFYPAELDYLNQIFPARLELSKFYVRGLKFTLNGSF